LARATAPRSRFTSSNDTSPRSFSYALENAFEGALSLTPAGVTQQRWKSLDAMRTPWRTTGTPRVRPWEDRVFDHGLILTAQAIRRQGRSLGNGCGPPSTCCIVSFRLLTGQNRSIPHRRHPGGRRYSIPVEISFRRRGLRLGLRSGQGQPRQSPHGHDSVHLTFGSAEQLRSRLGRSWRRYDPSSMPDLSARFHHRAASAICAGRRSLSCRLSPRPTATTASSPAARRCGATLWNAAAGKLQRQLSKTPNA